MSFETTAFFVLLVIAALPIMGAARRSARPIAFSILAMAVLLGLGLFWLNGQRELPIPESAVEGRPIEVRENDYVSSRACQSCHPDQYASWKASYHRTMTQVASADSVVGDFGGEEIRVYGQKVRPFERDGEFFLEMPALSPLMEGEEPPAKGRIERRVVMTTGLHHMQAYWYESGDDRRVALAPIVWLQELQRWVPEPSTFLRPPSQMLGRDQARWSEICQQCHSTGPQPRLPEIGQTGSIDTRVGEFGIACEACHGPGREHVEANRNPLLRYATHFRGEGDPTIINPVRLPPSKSSQVCGQCHSITTGQTEEDDRIARTSGPTYRPGDDLDQSRWVIDGRDRDSELAQQLGQFDPSFYSKRYWSDGEVRVSGREYQGLLASPCFDHDEPDARKMSCFSCHDLHPAHDDERPRSEWADDQLKIAATTDEACLGCHPGLPEDLSQHTHHLPRSSGSACTNCHMPHTSYGLLKAIRSHTVTSPDVAVSSATGRPNACNACHLDRSLGWAADRLSDWYGMGRPALTVEEEGLAASLLWLGTGDAGQRALVAWHMGWEPAREISGTDWMAPFLATLLDDPYDAVRYIAHRSLTRIPGYEDVEFDFVGRPGERREVARDVERRWADRDRNGATVGSALLIDRTGRLQSSGWNALVARRDDRPVRLEE